MSTRTEHADELWRMLVTVVMDTRDDWRRRVGEATGLPFGRVRALRRLVDGPRTLSELAEAISSDAPATSVLVNDLGGQGPGHARAPPHQPPRQAGRAHAGRPQDRGARARRHRERASRVRRPLPRRARGARAPHRSDDRRTLQRRAAARPLCTSSLTRY